MSHQDADLADPRQQRFHYSDEGGCKEVAQPLPSEIPETITGETVGHRG
jgi:hypothetical protein